MVAGVFRLLALSFPAEQRRDYGAEMLAAFAAAWGERRTTRGVAAAYAWLVRAFVDVLARGLSERWRLRRQGDAKRRGAGVMGELWMDVRVGVRRLVHARSFALAAVGMLALGIGANTAVFSALKAVLLSPPPYPEPDRLAWLAYEIGESAATADLLPWSWPKFKLLEEAPAGTVQAAAYGPRWFTLSGKGDPVRLYGEVVTGAYFDVLGRSPVLGRAFEDSETRAEESPLVATPLPRVVR